ncbi:hypothetical protein H5410_029585 [Solanum commersonii]|uniref:Uncharacterized protein n=1 Tax=Solanum commersonii TaxID=4109 RepID=A0A9J5YEE2_SOLCO|nr:hypothetical protein H5410_029585 [Solanum commersonii]
MGSYGGVADLRLSVGSRGCYECGELDHWALSVPSRALDGHLWNRLKRSWVWDPLFIEAISKWKFAFTVESKYRFQLDSIYVQIRCFKRLTSREFRGESSGDLGSEEASFEVSRKIDFGLERPLLNFEALDDICGIGSSDLGCGTHFSSKQSPNGNSPSLQIRCFKRLTSREFRGESSGDLGSEEASFERDRLSGRLWLSLVRLSMFRHLFIDLLEYGGVWVLSMLNFYSSCLRPYLGKVLDYDSMSLDIIEYPYLVVTFRPFGRSTPCRRYSGLESMVGNFDL